MIRSKINPARIYERIRIGRELDVKIPTNLYVDIEDWNSTKGKPRKTNELKLKKLENDLDILYEHTLRVINELNAKNELNANSIKENLNPKSIDDAPTDNKEFLVDYFNFYIDSLKNQINGGKTTKRKYNVIKGIIVDMEKYHKTKYKVKDVNQAFINSFDDYCKKVKKYMPNTAGRAIKFIKTVCRNARINGIETHIQLDSIKGYTIKTEFIILDKDEIKLIENYKFTKSSLDNARDWLIISCYTGQRVSDFLRFNSDMIVVEEGLNKEIISYIEFTQVKTDKEIKLPLNNKVLKIIEKRDGSFPKKISDQTYNKFIKKVCKEVGLTKITKGSKYDKNAKKKISGEYEKWELISSHVGRRSFSSHNYGKIPTPNIMYATGHSTERMLLNYIGKTNNDKALELYKYINNEW